MFALVAYESLEGIVRLPAGVFYVIFRFTGLATVRRDE